MTTRATGAMTTRATGAMTTTSTRATVMLATRATGTMTTRTLLLLGLLACWPYFVLGIGNDYRVGKKPDDTKPSPGNIKGALQPQKPSSSTSSSSSSSNVRSNWCHMSDDNCPENVCQQQGLVCCYCDDYCQWQPYGVIQPCFCCQKDYTCCSTAKPLWYRAPPNCCPPGTECSQDGSSCLKKIDPVKATPVSALCESTYKDAAPILSAKGADDYDDDDDEEEEEERDDDSPQPFPISPKLPVRDRSKGPPSRTVW